MRRSLATMIWVALTCFSAVVAAQAIKDPTRPPAGFGAAGENAATEAPPAGPVLQSVMLSSTRRSAIISGQLVSRGERYGDAVLAEVAEDHVVLNRGGSLQVLKMYPGAEKRKPK